jgi:hypothetical protein
LSVVFWNYDLFLSKFIVPKFQDRFCHYSVVKVKGHPLPSPDRKKQTRHGGPAVAACLVFDCYQG